MSSTNKTPNYKLSQFIGTDKPTFLGDYNNDMDIIDKTIFSASQSAEEAVNAVESVKSAQDDLKNVHGETQKQVEQLKEVADEMTGKVTEAQEAANEAEKKASEAQQSATDVLNAANTASANATKANQTASNNKTTIADLENRVSALEGEATKEPISVTMYLNTVPRSGSGITTTADPTLINVPTGYKLSTLNVSSRKTQVTVYGDGSPLGTTPYSGTNLDNYSQITFAPATFNPAYPSDVAVTATFNFVPEA